MSDRAKKSNLCYLVFHGGTKVCRALFEKRVKDLKPPEEYIETWTVDKFLQIKKPIIQSKLSSEKTLILYPGAQRTTDIRSWDISILCLLLIETCVLSSVIRMYVDQIRKQRNKIAHMRDSDIDDNAYQCIFEKLKVCFEKIVLEVKDDGLKTTIENILKELNTGSIPSDELIRVEEAIRQSCKDITEEVIYQGVETRKVLQKDNQEVSRRLDKLTSDVEEILRFMKGKAPVEIATPGINIKVPMQNCTFQAEKAIVKELNHEVDNDCDLPKKDMDNLKSTINELQEEFKEKGRPITSADVGCINLHIQCSSTLSLLNLIRDYLNGSLDESLKKLEKTARSLNGCEDLRLETVLYEDDVLGMLSDLVSDFGQLFRLAKGVTATSDHHSDLPVQCQSLENACDDKVSPEDCGQFEGLPAASDKSSDLLVQSRSLENASNESFANEDFGHFDRLAEGLPQASDSHSECKECDSVNEAAETNPSAEVIRILLIGKTGQGKSSTANSLVGQAGMFAEYTSSTCQTTTSQWSQQRYFLGRCIEVVDTPGIFDTESDDDNAKRHKELIKSLLLTIPGFHAIAYVLKCGEKITDEFKKTQDLFFEWFGPGVEKFTFVILTWCDSDETKDNYIYNGPQIKLTELIQKCGGRVCGIENKLVSQYTKRRQITKIYETVDAIKKSNGNCCFTNLTYKLAISYLHNHSPGTLSLDSIRLLENAGVMEELHDWLDNRFHKFPKDDSQSTRETRVSVSTDTIDQETFRAYANLQIFDATTKERISNTLLKTTYFHGIDQEKTSTKYASSDSELEGVSNKMSLVQNEQQQQHTQELTNVNKIDNGSKIKQKTVRKPSSRKDRKVDFGVSQLDRVAGEEFGSDSAVQDSAADTAVKTYVNNDDQVLTGFWKYLEKAGNFCRDKFGFDI